MWHCGYHAHNSEWAAVRCERDRVQEQNRAMYEEIERLKLENWQLKGALGYAIPGDIPKGDFKCGLCDARRRELVERER
jgi:hypothetical protein